MFAIYPREPAVPSDQPEDINALKDENERLKSSLRRCRTLIQDYRAKFAANANGDYRPPYQVDDRDVYKRC